MLWKVFYWGFLALVAAGLGFVYQNRLEIPLTRSFEETLDVQITAMEERRIELAEAIVKYEAEQKERQAALESAKSGSYSADPISALTRQKHLFQIMFIKVLQLLFTYRVIFYLFAFFIIFLGARRIFWRLYP